MCVLQLSLLVGHQHGMECMWMCLWFGVPVLVLARGGTSRVTENTISCGDLLLLFLLACLTFLLTCERCACYAVHSAVRMCNKLKAGATGTNEKWRKLSWYAWNTHFCHWKSIKALLGCCIWNKITPHLTYIRLQRKKKRYAWTWGLKIRVWNVHWMSFPFYLSFTHKRVEQRLIKT